jgi:hypothetical protein
MESWSNGNINRNDEKMLHQKEIQDWKELRAQKEIDAFVVP